MSIYDVDVSKLLGKEAYNYMLERVSHGFISDQHMRDISSQLHPRVRGNHLRRVGSGNLCDEAEFRRILGDWFCQEMCDLDQRTALSRLVSILRGPSLNLPIEGKRLEQILEAIKAKDNAVKTIVLLGESGVGKSSIGNCLLGLTSSQGFKVSRDTDSCTKETKEISSSWVTNGTECAIIDTPGLNDSDNEDTDHIRGIVEFLRHKERVNSFLVVRNGHNPRMNHSFKSMLSTFELTFFGEDFWHNVIIVVSSHSGYPNDPNKKFGIERWKRGIVKIFPKSAIAALETVVLDVEKKDQVRIGNEAKKLWKLISAMGSFECKDMKAVMADLDEKDAMIKVLTDELARVKLFAGIKVVFIVVVVIVKV